MWSSVQPKAMGTSRACPSLGCRGTRGMFVLWLDQEGSLAPGSKLSSGNVTAADRGPDGASSLLGGNRIPPNLRRELGKAERLKGQQETHQTGLRSAEAREDNRRGAGPKGREHRLWSLLAWVQNPCSSCWMCGLDVLLSLSEPHPLHL